MGKGLTGIHDCCYVPEHIAANKIMSWKVGKQIPASSGTEDQVNENLAIGVALL